MDVQSLADAVRTGDSEAVEALLAKGADANARNASGMTALMQAAFFGHSEIARVLLEGGADARCKDQSGLTASDWALRRGHEKVAELIQSALAAPDNGAARERAEEEARAQVVAPHAPAEDADQKAEGVTRLARASQEAQRPAAQERRRADEEGKRKRAEEQASRLLEEEALRRAAEAARLAREAEESRRLAEERARRVAEAEAARKRAEEEALWRAADVARLGRQFQEAQRRAEEEARKRADEEEARRRAEEEARELARKVSHPQAPPQDNKLVWALIICGFLVGSIIGLYVTSQLPALWETDGIAPAQTSANDANSNEGRAVVNGPLRGRQVALPLPAYPESALRAGASGAVTVQVEVSKDGDVTSARATDGHPLLRPAAVQAARKAKFLTQGVSTQAAKIPGTITYNFAPPQGDLKDSVGGPHGFSIENK